MLSWIVGDLYLPAGKDMVSSPTIWRTAALGTSKPPDSDRNSNRHLRRLEFTLTPCAINKTPNSNRLKTAFFDPLMSRRLRRWQVGSLREFPQWEAMNVNAAFTCHSQRPTRLGASVPQGTERNARARGKSTLWAEVRDGDRSIGFRRKTGRRHKQGWEDRSGGVWRGSRGGIRLRREPIDRRPCDDSRHGVDAFLPAGAGAARGAGIRVRERISRHGERRGDGDLHPLDGAASRGGLVGHVEFHRRARLERGGGVWNRVVAAGGTDFAGGQPGWVRDG